MAFLRIKYFYKVIFLIVFSITAYLVTNMYLVVDVPRAVSFSQRKSRANELDSIENPKYKYSVVVSSSSVRNSSSFSVSTSRDRDSHNGETNDLFKGDDFKTRHEGSQVGNENIAPHQPVDWFQGFKDQAVKLFYYLVPNSLSDFRKWAIQKEREFLEIEMRGYKFVESEAQRKLDDFIPEKGGEPIRNIVFTSWRSGSTFLGDLLNAHPGTFYHYEPLLPLGIVQVRSGKLAKDALEILRNVLYCNHTSDYISYGDEHWWFHSHNTRLAQFCEINHQVCSNANFISSMCRLFPFQSMKTVKIRLKLAKSLLDDPKLNIRLLYFIRDPRGMLQSRRHRDWCPGVPDCDSPQILCSDQEDDYHAAEQLRKEYPERFLALRYEDFSLNINSAAQKLFNFFRLRFLPEIQEFINNHTQSHVDGLYSITRISKTTPFHWRQDYEDNFAEVENIQSQCTTAMSLWGYKMANNKSHMLEFHPVGSPPWPEMAVPEDIETDLNTIHDT